MVLLISIIVIEYDYPESKNKIPFNEYYGKIVNRYVNFGFNHSGLPARVKTGYIDEYREGNDILYVTSASDNHFIISLLCILSILKTDIDASYGYIDLELNTENTQTLFRLFQFIERIQKRINITTNQLMYRRFSFANAPSWMNISDPSSIGGYAWKTIPLIDFSMEWKATVIYMDAGNVMIDDFITEKEYMKIDGFYSPISNGNLTKWVYPTTLEFMETYGMVPIVNRSSHMCSGGLLFFDYRNKTIRNRILKPLYQCSFTRKCISPIGSGRENHRQDQAVMSVLLAALPLHYTPNGHYKSNVQFHSDRFNQSRMLMHWTSFSNQIYKKIHLQFDSSTQEYLNWNDQIGKNILRIN